MRAQYKLSPEGGATNSEGGATNSIPISFLRNLRDSEGRRSVGIRRPWLEALSLSAALSLLFVFVYGLSNAFAAGRSNVGTCFFKWELHIPFLPALILPYMSIDLFFIASFPLCENKIELHQHARRIAAAILVAGLAFLMFPLTTGYPRPEVSGWSGSLFQLLWAFDRPHNLAPSLHVALASLLWPVYARHSPARFRRLVHVWFASMIVSPIFTWQHHVIDVATGVLLGQLCVFAFPERGDRALVRSGASNFRVARLYATGSAILVLLASVIGHWWWLLLWPAGSLALIAMAYVFGSSSIFRKKDGRLPISTRVVLGPYLLGAVLARLIYRRNRRPWIESAAGVYCGRLLTKREALAMTEMGITGVLDLTAEHSETRAFQGTEYLNVPVLDLTTPSREQSDAVVEFITKHAGLGGVYVHCALGVSRSAAAVSAYKASLRASSQCIEV